MLLELLSCSLYLLYKEICGEGENRQVYVNFALVISMMVFVISKLGFM